MSNQDERSAQKVLTEESATRPRQNGEHLGTSRQISATAATGFGGGQASSMCPVRNPALVDAAFTALGHARQERTIL